MLCEMCGKDTGELSLVKIEGAELHLCSSCAKFGTTVHATATAGGAAPGTSGGSARSPRRPPAQEKDVFAEMPPMELLSEWPQRIRKARESMGLSQDQFGTLLSEKSSVIHKLESGSIVPSDALVRKIERTLKIRIHSQPETS